MIFSKKCIPLYRVNQRVVSKLSYSLVISFSVINYVVSETSPRERRSLFCFYTPYDQIKKPSHPSQGMTECGY